MTPPTTEPPVAYQPPPTTTEAPATTTAPPTTTEAPATTTQPVATNTAPPTTTTAPPATNSGPESATVTCTRTAPESVSETSFYVDITINKGNINGFAKYIETIPAGLVASAKESAGGSFSFVDGKIKYVWVSLPTATSFKISYKVTVVGGTSGTLPIDGSFSHIENDETKRFALPVSNVNIMGTGSAAVTNATAPPTTTESPAVTKTTEPVTTTEAPVTKSTEPVTTTEAPAVTKTTEPVTTTEAPAVTKTTEPTATASATKTTEPVQQDMSASSIPSPQGNVAYSVQIAALHNARAPEQLAAMYNINQKVNTEMQDGYTKYVVGSHKVYKEAHDARDQIKIKGVSDAWVTAYNKGKRITVQEALMITSQKWYK